MSPHSSRIAPFIALLPAIALSGNVTVTAAGAMNLGSSAAYAATCSKEGLLDAGAFAEFMFQLQGRLTVQHWGQVKAQYQKSLHEKKQYTIASDRWIPFNVNSSNCRDLAKSLPLVLAALARQDAGTLQR